MTTGAATNKTRPIVQPEIRIENDLIIKIEVKSHNNYYYCTDDENKRYQILGSAQKR